MKNPRDERGFTLIESLVVIAIIGIMLVSMLPSIMNSLETRNLENSARDIQTTLQQARYRAVKDKVFYRIRFTQDQGYWHMRLETPDPADATGMTWIPVNGFSEKTISPRFVVTLNLPLSPEQAVEFSPVGVIEWSDSGNGCKKGGGSGGGNPNSPPNSLTLQSLKLKGQRQPDLRILMIFSGGSIRYEKTKSV